MEKRGQTIPAQVDTSTEVFNQASLGDLARSLCFLELQLFRSLRSEELLNQSWQKDEFADKMLRTAINRFNNVAYFVASTIVLQDSLEMRVRIIRRYLDLCDLLLELRNFNGIMEVLSGLNHTAVARLKSTWAVCYIPDRLVGAVRYSEKKGNS